MPSRRAIGFCACKQPAPIFVRTGPTRGHRDFGPLQALQARRVVGRGRYLKLRPGCTGTNRSLNQHSYSSKSASIIGGLANSVKLRALTSPTSA